MRYAGFSICIVMTVLWHCGGAAAAPTERRQNVILLHSRDRNSSYSQLQEQGILHALSAPGVAPFRLHIEYLNDEGGVDERSDLLLRDLFALRYQNDPITLVVTMDTAAFEFAARFRTEAFHGAPIVFSGLSDAKLADTARGEITGVLETVDLRGTLDLMRRMQPSSRRFGIIVDDTGHGQHLRQLAEAALDSMPERPEVVWLTDNEPAALLNSIRKLPADTPLLFLAHVSVVTLPVPDSRSLLNEICEAAQGPVYTLYDAYLGSGVVGGLLTSGEFQGQTAGELARRILGGERASAIPIVRQSPNRYMFDGRALERWKLPRSALPADSLIRYERPSMWQWYGEELLFAAVLVILQAGAILVLLWERRRRIRAEADHRESEQRYRTLVEHSPDATLVHDGKVWLFANPAAARMLGADQPEMLVGRDIFEIVPGESAGLIQQRVRQILERGEVAPRIPIHLKRLDGGRVYAEVTGSPCTIAGRQCVQAVFHDMTGHREAEFERDRFFNVALDVLCVATLDGYFKRVNPAFERLTGYSAAELTSKQFVDFVHPDDRERTLRELASIFDGVDCDGFENRYMRRDGTYRWVRWRCPAAAPGDTLIYASAHDVTEARAAADTLRRNEARVRQVIDLVPHFIFAKDREGRFILVNRALADAYGTTVENIIGRTDADFARSAEEVQHFRRDDLEVIESGRPKLIPIERITDATGRVRLLQTIKIPFTEAASELPSVLGVATDITDLKRVEEALRSSEQTFRQFADSVDEIFWISDVSPQRMVFVNAAHARVWGCSVEALYSDILAWQRFIHPEDRPRVHKQFDRWISGAPDADYQVEYRVIRPDGDVRWIHDRGVRISDATGAVTRVFGVAEDFTERHLAYEALRASEHKYRTLIETTDTGFAVLDDDGRILDANAEYVRLTGRSSVSEIRGRSVLEWTASYDLERNAEELRKCASTGQVRRLEIDYIHPTGAVLPIEVNATVVQAPEGTRVLSMCRDISERRRAHETMIREQRMFARGPVVAFRWRAEPDWPVEHVSSNVSQYGYSATDFTSGRIRYADIIHPDDRAQIAAEVSAHSAAGEACFEQEYRIRTAEGRYVPLYDFTNIIRDAQNRITHYEGYVLDITERKLAEEEVRRARDELEIRVEERTAELRRAADELSDLYNRAPCGYHSLDEDGRYVRVNDTELGWLGYQREELIGRRTIRDLMSPEYVNWFDERFAQFKREGFVTGVEFELIRKDGTRFPVLLNATAVRGADGRFAFTRSTVFDITERRRTDAELRRQAQVLAQIHDAVIVTDLNAIITDWNAGATRIFGYSAAEAIGRHITLIYFEGEADAVKYDVIEPLQRMGSNEFEVRRRTKSGAEIYVHTSLSILRDERGVPIGYIGYTTDISARRRAEERARRYQADLTHVGRLTIVGQMSSALAHEINQPLQAIAYFTNGCLKRLENGGADAASLIGPIRETATQARRAGEVVRRLREFSRKREPQRSTVVINELVQEACRFAEHDAGQRGVRTRLNLAKRLPIVFVDRVQIAQVLLNLIRNAADAMQGNDPAAREITITTARLETGEIEIRVEDSGPGLSEEVRSRLFDAFFSTKEDGMGIGLSISRSIVEAHEGRLVGENRPSGGAVFSIQLPTEPLETTAADQ